jgi:hypothetical protein
VLASFTHWACREIGDVRTTSAVTTLLAALSARGVLSRSRARLHRGYEGVRSALLIDLPEPMRGDSPLAGFVAFWLVESPSRKVLLLGLEGRYGGSPISGRVIHGVPALDPAAPWVLEVARHSAGSLLRKCGARPLSDTASTNRVELLAQVEAAVLRAAIVAFREGLDSESLGILDAERTGDLHVYNHYRALEGEPARNRIQAARAYPWFGDVLRRDWRLRRTVESGKPLAPVLAERFGVAQSTLRRCQALHASDVPRDARPLLLKLADALPADYRPRAPGDWNAFSDVAAPLTDLAGVLEMNVARLATPFGGGAWRHGLAELQRRSGSVLDVPGIFDVMHATYRYGVRPAVAAALRGPGVEPAADPPSGFFALWFGRYDLPRLHVAAVRWRDTGGRLASRRLAAGHGDSLAWPPLWAPSASRGPYRVVELTSLRALEAEGERMESCVASYAAKCLLTGSAVYSLRDRAGNALSTFEVSVADGAPVLRQHWAVANSLPSKALRDVVEAFVAELSRSASTSQVADVLRQRLELGTPLRPHLGQPDRRPPELTAEESAAFAEAVAFAHPSEARRGGIMPFLAQRGRQVLDGMLRPVATVSRA